MMLHAMRRARPLCQGLRVGNAVAVQHRSMSMTSMFSGLMSGLGGLTGMKMPEGVKPEEAQRMAAKMMQNPELVQMMQDPKFQVIMKDVMASGGNSVALMKHMANSESRDMLMKLTTLLKELQAQDAAAK